MTRRTLLALPFALRLRADAARDVWEVISEAASALSEGDVPAFLDCFDSRMPGYEQLRANVTGLIAEAYPPREMGASEREGIFCSIGPVTDEGDEKARSLEVDWIMDIRQRTGGSNSARRQQRIKLRAEKQGKKWKIVSLEPVSFFAPPD